MVLLFLLSSFVLLGAGFIQVYGLSLSHIGAWGILTIVPSIWTFFWIKVLKIKKSARILQVYGYLVLLLGPFATMGCLFMLLYSRERTLLQEFREYLAYEAEFTPQEKLEYGMIENYWAGDNESLVDPFIDNMKGVDSLIKRSTIDKVMQHPGVYSKHILELGLHDENPDIRFYAASGLNLLNESFMKKFTEAKREIKSHDQVIRNYLRLAEQYSQYYEWGLPDAEDRPRYVFLIKECYEKALEIAPHNLEATVGMAKIALEEKDATEALRFLDKAVELQGEISELLPLYMEGLYLNKDFYKMRMLAIQYSKNKHRRPSHLEDESFKESLLYWENLEKKEEEDDALKYS